MLKNILISAFAVILLLAIGFSAYNVFAGRRTEPAQAVSSQPVTETPGSGQGNAGQGLGNAQGQNGVQGQDTWQAGAQGRGGGQGGRGRGGQGGGQAGRQTNPQSGFTGYTTYQGTVSDYAAPNFTLVTTDGQKLPVQLGNLNYVANLGITIKDGDQVTITGFQDASGAIAAGTITVDATGQTFTLRTETGRPSWAGRGRN